MFSHLCRACMVELDQLDPTQTVPLFEEHQNLLLSRVCTAMNLSINEDDNLGQNVCNKCAETIMEFYSFHLMFTKSNRKLCKMLIEIKAPEADNKLNDGVHSVVQTSLFGGGFVDGKHKCKRCLVGFDTRVLLRRHVAQVHKSGSVKNSTDTDPDHRWKCSCCTSRFRTRDLKNMHQKECRRTRGDVEAEIVIVEVKESEFIDYNDFDTNEFHSGSEANNVVVGDDDDDVEDGSVVQIESKYNPNMAATGEKWKCKKCSAWFDSLESLHVHESCSHNMENHMDSKFFANLSIKEERVDFEEVKTEKESTNEYNVNNTQHNSAPRWKCSTCFDAFETRELLRVHRRNHITGGTRKVTQTIRTGWTCNICNLILPSRDKVRLHKNTNHPNEKRERRCNNETKNWGDVGAYDCELCNKTFISKSKIRKHMDIHKNKDRPKRLCTICGLELCSTYNLNNHIRTVHGRERKFHCTQCDRRFSHSHHLKTHMNRHEGIRPFQCEQCVKSFFDKTTLREHVKSVHLNLKAYACKICSRTFNRSGNMRAHMSKTHHLGDLGDASRSFGIRSLDNEPTGDDIEDFPARHFALAEPFRSMIIKSSN